MTKNVDLLISDLYAAANGRVAWQSALANIANHLDLWLVQLMSVDSRNGSLQFNVYGGDGNAPDAALDYVRFYNTIDPRLSLGLETPREKWISSRESHSDEFVANNRYYQDFLIPYGGGHMLGAKLIEVEHTQFLLAMVERHGGRILNPDSVPFLHQLKHHLNQALQCFVALQNTYAEFAVADAFLGQFARPMFLVDQFCALANYNEAAKDLLARGDLLTERDGYMRCAMAADSTKLNDAVASLNLIDSEVQSAPTRRVVKMQSTRGSSYLAFVSAMRPQETMGVFGQSSRALVVLHDPGAAQAALDPFVVAECFDLTPAQANVAVHLTNGLVAKEIARQGGISLPTVRSHIRAIMGKTGTVRQADLVRILLSIPARAQ